MRTISPTAFTLLFLLGAMFIGSAIAHFSIGDYAFAASRFGEAAWMLLFIREARREK